MNETMRVGTGFDVHRLVEGRRLILGGVEIPFLRGLLGWSDADVAVHAIIDALLGAAALGDIGSHFPSDDPKYRNISSLLLLEHTRDMLTREGWQITNIDATIIAQEPELRPHIPQMRQRIGAALDLPQDRVGIKAKTADHLGPVGSGEGMAAHAVALIKREASSEA